MCTPSVTQQCLELHPVRTSPACSWWVLKRRKYNYQPNCQAVIVAVLEENLENEEFNNPWDAELLPRVSS